MSSLPKMDAANRQDYISRDRNRVSSGTRFKCANDGCTQYGPTKGSYNAAKKAALQTGFVERGTKLYCRRHA